MNFLDTDKLVVLSYPPGGGGKFVANCMSLSVNVLPMIGQANDLFMQKVYYRSLIESETGKNVSLVEILRELGAEVETGSSGILKARIEGWNHFILRYFRRYNDIRTRLNWISGTLPSSHDDLSSWLNLEFYSPTTYDGSLKNLCGNNLSRFNSVYFEELKASSFLHFSVHHQNSELEKLRNYFPNLRQIRFINTATWIDHCLSAGKRFGESFKTHDSDLIPGGVDFNVETYFSAAAFLAEVEMLYQHFGLPDYDEEAISTFYNGYMKAHGIL